MPSVLSRPAATRGKDPRKGNQKKSSKASKESSLEDEILDREFSALLKHCVAILTRGNYESNQVTFVMWLFDNQEKYGHLMKKAVLTALKKHHDKDQKNLTKNGDINKNRVFLREAVKDLLRAIVAGDKKTVPLYLEKLDFKTFSRYLSTFKKTVRSKKKVD